MLLALSKLLSPLISITSLSPSFAFLTAGLTLSKIPTYTCKRRIKETMRQMNKNFHLPTLINLLFAPLRTPSTRSVDKEERDERGEEGSMARMQLLTGETNESSPIITSTGNDASSRQLVFGILIRPKKKKKKKNTTQFPFEPAITPIAARH